MEHHLEDSEKENEQLFEEVKRLKLENFQQAATLRQQLWKEFSERFSVIQEEHKYVCACTRVSICLCVYVVRICSYSFIYIHII